MAHMAPTHWPVENRKGFCWGTQGTECNMSQGNPHGSFWKELGVNEFTSSINFQMDYSETDKWAVEFPAREYPVIALRGAPASYPIKAEHRSNQKFMKWSDDINAQVDDYISSTFGMRFVSWIF